MSGRSRKRAESVKESGERQHPGHEQVPPDASLAERAGFEPALGY